MSDDHESAIVYGRAEGCWVDYQRNFSLERSNTQAAIPVSTVGIPSIIEIDGLPPFHLPDINRAFYHEAIHSDRNDATAFSNLPEKSVCSTTPPKLLRDLHTHLELPELTANSTLALASHREQISSRIICDFASSWLPFVSTDDDRDEGMRFPPNSERLHTLLVLKLEKEATVKIASKDFSLGESVYELDASLPPTESSCSERLATILKGKPEILLSAQPTCNPRGILQQAEVLVVDLTVGDSSEIEQEWTESSTSVVSAAYLKPSEPAINYTEEYTPQTPVRNGAQPVGAWPENVSPAVIVGGATPSSPCRRPSNGCMPEYAILPIVPNDLEERPENLALLTRHGSLKSSGVPNLCLLRMDGSENDNLPWAPVPGKDCKIPLETTVCISPNACLIQDSPWPSQTSVSKPSILETGIERPIPEAAVTKSRVNKGSLQESGLLGLINSATGNPSQRLLHKSFVEPNLLKNSTCLLPRSGDAMATTKLIAGFMELRKAKKQ